MASNHGDGGFKEGISIEQPQDNASDLMTKEQCSKLPIPREAESRVSTSSNRKLNDKETQQSFARRLEEDHSTSHFNKSDTAHFYEASSGLPN